VFSLARTLGLIYTAPAIVETVTKLASEMMPDVERINITDDMILKFIGRTGMLTPPIHAVVLNYIRNAQEEGANAVLVTCSSISPCVDSARPLVSIPVMKIDDPMTDIAVQKASKIGIVATLRTTLEPTKYLLSMKARARSKDITLKTELCEGAFEALSHKDTATHDKLVLEGIRKTASNVELIVLAQASMARLVPRLGNEISIPILSSLPSGVEQAKAVLGI
jgi:Asp/Glu/hydantoin racemase